MKSKELSELLTKQKKIYDELLISLDEAKGEYNKLFDNYVKLEKKGKFEKILYSIITFVATGCIAYLFFN